MNKLVAIGKIVRTWGIRGDLVIDLISGRQRKLSAFQELFAGMKSENLKEIILKSERFFKRQIIARFKDVDSIEKAEAFVGSCLFVKADELDPLHEDEFYIDDLIGLDVILGDDRKIGTVRDVIETGGTDILLVEEKGKEMLIPLTGTICREIDIIRGVVIIDPPEGLLDLDEV